MILYLLIDCSYNSDSCLETLQNLESIYDKAILYFNNSPTQEFTEKLNKISNNKIQELIIENIELPNHSVIYNKLVVASNKYNPDYIIITKSTDTITSNILKTDLANILTKSESNFFAIKSVRDNNIASISLNLFKSGKYVWKYRLGELIEAEIKNVILIPNLILKTNFIYKKEDIDIFEKEIIEKNMVNNYAVYTIAILYHNSKEYEKSVKYLKDRFEMLALSNSDNEFYVTCIKLSGLTEIVSEKIYYLKKAIIYYPQRLEAYFYLILIYILNNQYREALKIHSEIEEIKEYNILWKDTEIDIYDYKYEYNICVLLDKIGKYDDVLIKLNKLLKKYPDNKNANNLLNSILNKSEYVISKNNKIETLISNNFYDKLDSLVNTLKDIKFVDGLTNIEYTLTDKIKLESIIGRKIKMLHKDNGKFAKNIELEYKENCYFCVVNLDKNNLEITLSENSSNNEIEVGNEKIYIKYNNIYICRLENKIVNLNPNLCKIFLFI